jgi:hypothetical protein
MSGEISPLRRTAATYIALVTIPLKANVNLRFIGTVAVIVVLVAFNCRAAEYDPGGDPALVMSQVMAARQRGETVEIRGICYSACALKLAAGSKLCVSPTSRIGVHEVRQASFPWGYQQGARDHLWTGFFAGMLPACARQLFNERHAFDGGRLAVVAGYEILGACPTIRTCASQ